MKIFNLSIKQRLISGGFFILLLLIAIGFVSQLMINKVLLNNSILIETKDLLIAQLNMRKFQDAFLVEDIKNEDFFKTENSENISKFKNEYNKAIAISKKLQVEKKIINLNLTKNFIELEQINNINNLNFYDLINNIK